MLSPGVLFVLVSINLSNIHRRGCVRSPADLSAITHGESMTQSALWIADPGIS